MFLGKRRGNPVPRVSLLCLEAEKRDPGSEVEGEAAELLTGTEVKKLN